MTINHLMCTSTTSVEWTHNWKLIPGIIISNPLKLPSDNENMQGSFECVGTDKFGHKFLGVAFVFMIGM